MNTLRTICISAIGMLVIISGCKKSETIAPDPNQCYEGIVIAKDCPSYLFVQVNNARIGANWELKHNYSLYENKTYNNAIAINNSHLFDSLDLKPNDKIYFTINIEASKNPDDCIKMAPCTLDIRFASYPEKHFCIKTISRRNCD